MVAATAITFLWPNPCCWLIMSLLIRSATHDDVETIADFNCRLAAETENKTLDGDTILAGVRNALSLTDEVTYFVAESNDEVIGQLMLTREWSDWRNGWMYWLQSVYVHDEHRGAGVFRSLLEHAAQKLKERKDVVGIRLYVEKENTGAQETYRRLGFSEPGYSVMEMNIR